MNNSARPINELTGIKKRSSVLVRGNSHKEIAIQNGFIPPYFSDAQYLEFYRGLRGFSTYELWTQIPGNENKTEDDFFAELAISGAAGLVAAVAAATAARDAAIAQVALAAAQVALAEDEKDLAVAAKVAAEAARDDALDALADMEALVLSFEQASVAEIRAGTNDTKYNTPKDMKDANAFYAAQAGELAANVWTPDMNSGWNRSWQIAANSTLANPTNMADGIPYIWNIKQAAAGGFTLAFGNKFDWGDVAAPTMPAGANKKLRVTGTYDADADKIIAYYHKAA